MPAKQRVFPIVFRWFLANMWLFLQVFTSLKSHRKNLSMNLPFLLLARHQSRMFTILINLRCIAVAAPTFRLLQDAIEEGQTRFMSPFLNGYCWWTKSCTTKDDGYPVIYRVLTIPGGAGFLPSTVAIVKYSQPIPPPKHILTNPRTFSKIWAFKNHWFPVHPCC